MPGYSQSASFPSGGWPSSIWRCSPGASAVQARPEVNRLRAADVVLVGPYPPPYGGVSVHVARFLAWCRRFGVDCVVLATTPLSTPASDDESIRQFSASEMVRIAAFRRGRQVVLHSSRVRGAVIGFALSVFGVHVTFYLHNGRSLEQATRGGLAGLAFRMALRRAERVIVVSEEVAQLTRRIGLGPRTQLSVQSAFLPPCWEGDCLAAGRAEPRVPDDVVVLGWCGRLSGDKSHIYGFEFLLRIMGALADHGARVRAVIGTGDALAAADLSDEGRRLLARFSAACEIAPPTKEYVEQMPRLSVFLRPTTTDGDSVAIREALWLGVPVLASNVVRRPDGCHVQPLGDLGGWVAWVRKLADGPRPAPGPVSGPPERCSFDAESGAGAFDVAGFVRMVQAFAVRGDGSQPERMSRGAERWR